MKRVGLKNSNKIGKRAAKMKEFIKTKLPSKDTSQKYVQNYGDFPSI